MNFSSLRGQNRRLAASEDFGHLTVSFQKKVIRVPLPEIQPSNYLTVKVMLSQVKVRPLVHIKCKFLKIGKMDNFDQDALK